MPFRRGHADRSLTIDSLDSKIYPGFIRSPFAIFRNDGAIHSRALKYSGPRLRDFSDFYPQGQLPKFERTLTPREEDDDLVQIDARLKELGKRSAPMPRQRVRVCSDAFSELGTAFKSPKGKRESCQSNRKQSSRVYEARKAEKECHTSTKLKSKTKGPGRATRRKLSEDQPTRLPSTPGKKKSKAVECGIERVDETDHSGHPVHETERPRQMKLEEASPSPRNQPPETENVMRSSLDSRYGHAHMDLIAHDFGNDQAGFSPRAEVTLSGMPGRLPRAHQTR